MNVFFWDFERNFNIFIEFLIFHMKILDLNIWPYPNMIIATLHFWLIHQQNFCKSIETCLDRHGNPLTNRSCSCPCGWGFHYSNDTDRTSVDCQPIVCWRKTSWCIGLSYCLCIGVPICSSSCCLLPLKFSFEDILL